MKRALLVAWMAAALAAACSDSAETKADPGGGMPVPGSGATSSSGGSGTSSIPSFNLDGGGGQVPPPDPLPTFDFDAAQPNPVPPEPEKRSIWAVDEMRHLVRILAEDPANVIDVAPIDLPAGEQVLGMDFRPSTGALYVLTTASQVYTIDRTTAKTTAAFAEPLKPALSGQAFGIDFNPVADAIRVHSDIDQNLRINATTGVVAGDKTLTFAQGDVNFGQSPNLIGSAYTNSVSKTPATTALFAIDSTRNLLAKVAPPNDGVVTTIGPLGVDIAAMAGFDIWGSDGALEAYAALRVDGVAETGLYRINLDTGAATLVGPIAHPIALRGIAVKP